MPHREKSKAALGNTGAWGKTANLFTWAIAILRRIVTLGLMRACGIADKQ
jgi:hypothetical protein